MPVVHRSVPAYRRWSIVGPFLSSPCSSLHVLAARHPEGEELITPERAVAIALEGNPGLAQIKARAEAMAAIPSQEGTLPDPTLSFGALWLPTASGLSLHTVLAIMAGLLPIMWGTGTGSEVMRRIAAPMVGGHPSCGTSPYSPPHRRAHGGRHGLVDAADPDRHSGHLRPGERKLHSAGKKETYRQGMKALGNE